MSASELALLEEERDQLREERDELLSLVKRSQRILEDASNSIIGADELEQEIWAWLIDHPEGDACPECGNRPPTICKMSCDTRTY